MRFKIFCAAAISYLLLLAFGCGDPTTVEPDLARTNPSLYLQQAESRGELFAAARTLVGDDDEPFKGDDDEPSLPGVTPGDDDSPDGRRYSCDYQGPPSPDQFHEYGCYTGICIKRVTTMCGDTFYQVTNESTGAVHCYGPQGYANVCPFD